MTFELGINFRILEDQPDCWVLETVLESEIVRYRVESFAAAHALMDIRLQHRREFARLFFGCGPGRKQDWSPRSPESA